MHTGALQELVTEIQQAIPAFRRVNVPGISHLEESLAKLNQAMDIGNMEAIIFHFGSVRTTFKLLCAEHESRLKMLLDHPSTPKA